MSRGNPPGRSSQSWEKTIRPLLGDGVVHLIGVGNPLRQDDGVGLRVVSSLRRELGQSPRPGIKVHPPSLNPEKVISKAASRGERLLIFDAVEADREPGSIICASLAETKFGFFATHNLPLRLIPGIAENQAGAFVVGIQPESAGVGEGLSEKVQEAGDRLVQAIKGIVEGNR